MRTPGTSSCVEAWVSHLVGVRRLEGGSVCKLVLEYIIYGRGKMFTFPRGRAQTCVWAGHFSPGLLALQGVSAMRRGVTEVR